MNDLAAVNAKVIAASVDPEDKAREVADEVSYPVSYGATIAEARLLDSWWEERRGIIQPSEFLVNREGKILTSSYSSGPIGRINPGDVVKMINYIESLNK
ncbi:MAG: hypothetical protein CMM74_15420 [Rhodospirillaceae bacterium]|nr:hypothetical protein [Rhodospirillaceae bacterium]